MIKTNQIVFGNNSISDYVISKQDQQNKLGEGSYGAVFKASFKKDPNIIVAVKYVKYDSMRQGFPSTSLREISLLKTLKSPYIVKLLDVVHDNQKLLLVFQHHQMDLHKYITKIREKGEPLNSMLTKKLMFQLISGVSEIHQKRIIHRDLKPSNILVDEDLNLKVADFGLARTYCIPPRPYSDMVVTQHYRAPQLLIGIDEYSISIDMWSVGCIFAQLIIQKPLFPGLKNDVIDQLMRIFRYLGTPDESVLPGITKKLAQIDFPQIQLRKLEDSVDDLNLDKDGLHLLNALLEFNPAKRISAKQALKHPYFHQLRNSV